MLDFPTIHTNFWDAILAIPSVMILTQLIKLFFPIRSTYIPTIALAIGLTISLTISHRHDWVAGLFMGWFYGYAAIGNYAGLKTAVLAYRKSE